MEFHRAHVLGHAAGIEAGDVILSFDGKDIAKMRRLPRVVAETQIGKSARVDIWHCNAVGLYSGYPNQTGGVDTTGRYLAQQMSGAWGQNVITDNRPGAGGSIAAELVAKAAPDGYTILGCSSSYALNPSLLAGANYDPLKDFIPLMLVGASPNVYVVTANSPHKTMKDLLAFVRANPGKLNWTSAGEPCD